jgi:hypothetical protein
VGVFVGVKNFSAAINHGAAHGSGLGRRATEPLPLDARLRKVEEVSSSRQLRCPWSDFFFLIYGATKFSVFFSTTSPSSAAPTSPLPELTHTRRNGGKMVLAYLLPPGAN